MKDFSRRQLLLTFVPAMLVVGAVAYVRIRFGITTALMTGDIAALSNMHPLTGVVSNLGVLLWCSAAAVAAFAAVVLRKSEQPNGSGFLLGSALLTTYLLLDDLFLVHEDLAERYLGAAESVVFVVLLVAVVTYFIAFRRDILRTDFRMLIIAASFLASSLLLDRFVVDPNPVPGSGMFFLEDSTKWLGIACWCSYFIRTSYTLVAAASRHPVAESAVVAAEQ